MVATYWRPFLQLKTGEGKTKEWPASSEQVFVFTYTNRIVAGVYKCLYRATMQTFPSVSSCGKGLGHTRQVDYADCSSVIVKVVPWDLTETQGRTHAKLTVV